MTGSWSYVLCVSKLHKTSWYRGLFTQDERYIPYQFGECVWTTPHNHNHGYVRDIIAVDSYGKEVG